MLTCIRMTLFPLRVGAIIVRRPAVLSQIAGSLTYVQTYNEPSLPSSRVYTHRTHLDTPSEAYSLTASARARARTRFPLVRFSTPPQAPSAHPRDAHRGGSTANRRDHFCIMGAPFGTCCSSSPRARPRRLSRSIFMASVPFSSCVASIVATICPLSVLRRERVVIRSPLRDHVLRLRKRSVDGTNSRRHALRSQNDVLWR